LIGQAAEGRFSMADKMVQDKSTPGPVSGEITAAMKSGGESQGDSFPNANTGKKPKFHGGQTEQAITAAANSATRRSATATRTPPHEQRREVGQPTQHRHPLESGIELLLQTLNVAPPVGENPQLMARR
jgi:hypothetical protein